MLKFNALLIEDYYIALLPFGQEELKPLPFPTTSLEIGYYSGNKIYI